MNTLKERISQIDKLKTQREFLGLINQYNSLDRKVIKQNYKRILREFDIQPKEVMELGFAKNNVYAWSTCSSPNIPMFDQALTIAVAFHFSIEEFLKKI